MRQMYQMIVAFVIVVCFGVVRADAQRPVITSFHGNGALTWTNEPGGGLFSVEWASSLTGTWFDTWSDLRYVPVTGTTATVQVPIFYRVRRESESYGADSLTNTWFVTLQDPDVPYVYMVFDGAGTLNDFGAFDKGTPPGYYTVNSDGTFCLGLFIHPDSGPDSEGFTVGRLDSPTEGKCWKPFFGDRLYRVDESVCQGDWTGTIINTNTVPGTNNVAFSVLASGQVTNFIGFAPPVTGRMLSDSNGNVVAFFWTGETSDDREMRIHGTLSGNTMTGTYRNDAGGDGPHGPVNLNR
jgi:hypothetical protein